MDSVKRIARNVISLSIAELIGKFGQFLIFVYIARAMGNVIFGTFNFAYAFSLIAIVFADIGINFMLVRETSKHKDRIADYIGNSFLIKILFSILTFAVIIAIMNAGKFPQLTRRVVYLVFLYITIRSFCELLFVVFRAYEKMHYEAFIKLITTIALAAAVFFAIYRKWGILIISIIYVIVQFFIFFLTFILVFKKFTKISFRLDSSLSREIIKKASPFTLSLIFAGIYFYIDSIMLSLIKGDAEVGIYSAAYNITLAILVVPAMYTYAIYPILSRRFGENESKEDYTTKLIYERSFKYLYMIGLPVSVGMFALSRQIIIFIYGNGYYGSIIALQILSWFVFMKFLSYLTGIILSSIDKQYLRMYSQGLSALVNFGINLLLIPKYGLVGAGIATVLSEFMLFLSSHIFVSKYFCKIKISSMLLKPVAASLVMYAAVYFINVPTLLRIFIGAAAYGIAIIALRFLDKQDILFIKKIIPHEGLQRMIPYEE